MKIKTIVSIFSIFFAFGALHAQNQIPLQGDVIIEDDPTTTTVTEGNLNVSGNFIVGTGSASGTNSVSLAGANVLGSYSLAFGNYASASQNAIALGDQTLSTGLYSIALGYCSYAVEDFAFAAGEFACALGSDSIALGYNCHADGYSAALGNSAYAVNGACIAIGSECYASGRASVVLGYYVNSGSYKQTSIGTCNDDSIAGSSTEWILTDPLFVVGNGTAYDQRSNALVMLKNGDTTLSGHMTAKSYTVTEAAGGIPMGPFARQQQ